VPKPQPVFDVLTCTYGEALSIYLYAHRQIADVRDVGQAEVIRTKVDARIDYITRGADSEHRSWSIPLSVDEFAFDLQQTLARYAAGLVDAEIHGKD
jgi:hypothetical protein